MPAAAAHEDLEEAAILDEEAYENEGNDFAVGFGPGGKDAGAAPERPTETDMGGGGRDDW